MVEKMKAITSVSHCHKQSGELFFGYYMVLRAVHWLFQGFCLVLSYINRFLGSTVFLLLKQSIFLNQTLCTATGQPDSKLCKCSCRTEQLG